MPAKKRKTKKKKTTKKKSTKKKAFYGPRDDWEYPKPKKERKRRKK